MKKPSTSGRPSIYQTVTDRIISNLKAGMIPWEKPWKTPRYSGGPFPRNFYTGKPYRGINVLLLWSSEYISPFWLTFKQAQALKGTVRKGEHGTPIIFYKQLPEHATKDEKAPGEDERVPFVLCHYAVFVLLCLPVDRFCFAGEKQKNAHRADRGKNNGISEQQQQQPRFFSGAEPSRKPHTAWGLHRRDAQPPAPNIDFICTDPPSLVNYCDRAGRSIQNDNNADWLKPAFRASNLYTDTTRQNRLQCRPRPRTGTEVTAAAVRRR
jgi:hypothetical protein